MLDDGVTAQVARLTEAAEIARHIDARFAISGSDPAFSERLGYLKALLDQLADAVRDCPSAIRVGTLSSAAALAEGWARSLAGLRLDEPFDDTKHADAASSSGFAVVGMMLEVRACLVDAGAEIRAPEEGQISIAWATARKWLALCEATTSKVDAMIVATTPGPQEDPAGVRDLWLCGLSLSCAAAMLSDSDLVDPKSFMERLADAERAFRRFEERMARRQELFGPHEPPPFYFESVELVRTVVSQGTAMAVDAMVARGTEWKRLIWRDLTQGRVVSTADSMSLAEEALSEAGGLRWAVPSDFYQLADEVRERWSPAELVKDQRRGVS